MDDTLRDELQGYNSKLTKLRFQAFVNPSKENFSAVVNRCSELESKFADDMGSLGSIDCLEKIQSLHEEKTRRVNGSSPDFSYFEFAGFLRDVLPVSFRKDFIYELIAHKTGIGVGKVEAIASSRVDYKSYGKLISNPSEEIVREFFDSIEDK